MTTAILSLFTLVSSHRVSHFTEANSSWRDLSVNPWSSFDLQNPQLSRSTEEAQVYEVVEKPRFGKLPDYEVFYVGTPDARVEPKLVYKHDNKFLSLDANIKDSSGKAILEWRGYRWPSAKASSKAFLTSPGKGMGKETYYTMTQLTKWGAHKAAKNNELGHLSTSWLSTAETFTLDSGRCPKNKKSACGKRIINAQGDKMGHWMRIYTPDKERPVAVSAKIKRKLTVLGMADVYELTVQPGQDPLLMAQFACFIDAANNIESYQD